MIGVLSRIKRGGFDLIVEDVSPFSPIGTPVWKKHVPHLASVQNLLGLHATQKFGAIGWGPRWVEKELLQMYKCFVAVSPGIAHRIQDTLNVEVNCRVIPNSCSPLFFEEISNKSHTTQIASPPKSDYILSLGRIDVYQKGLDDLVNAFDRVAEHLPDIKLVIAGSGMDGQVEVLKRLVCQAKHRDRIELVGQVEQSRAAKLMRESLFVAIPSRYEGWPLAALEAAAVGVPVVGTNIVGIRDAAPQFPAGHGELVDPGDIAGLTRAFYKVATDKKRRADMASRGSKWAREYSWDKLAEEQLEFYTALLGK